MAVDKHFVPVTDLAALEPLLARSRQEPVLLFEHDTACPISVAAHRELARLPGEIPTIDVARSRAVSLAVATMTGVTHESPQAIVFRDGEAVWSASHFDITADEVTRALREHA